LQLQLARIFNAHHALPCFMVRVLAFRLVWLRGEGKYRR
jgi:hypothetical protein